VADPRVGLRTPVIGRPSTRLTWEERLMKSDERSRHARQCEVLIGGATRKGMARKIDTDHLVMLGKDGGDVPPGVRGGAGAVEQPQAATLRRLV
jgi:hypothetical protein